MTAEEIVVLIGGLIVGFLTVSAIFEKNKQNSSSNNDEINRPDDD